MTTSIRVWLFGLLLVAAFSSPTEAQVYKYYSPGSVWAVQLVRIKYGQEQNYLAYLDGPFKRIQEGRVKAGILKSYKVLRTMDDDYSSWNMMLMYEYANLAAYEASAQRSDSVSLSVAGTEQGRAQGAEDRTKQREPVGSKLLREYILK